MICRAIAVIGLAALLCGCKLSVQIGPPDDNAAADDSASTAVQPGHRFNPSTEPELKAPCSAAPCHI